MPLGIVTPPANATSSTFQVGTYTSLTDTFTSVFDLNDGVTTNIMWNTLKLPQPEKAFVRSFNLRAPGERVTRFQYKNRHIQVSVSLRGATVQAILNTCHSLIAAIENPPYRLRLAQPNATQYTYATVVAVTHNIPADPQTLLAKALPNVQIDFECLPGLLGDRVTLQNLIVNPGFEAPSGPGVQVFGDSFVSTNAYALQTGNAPTLNAATTWVDVVEFGTANAPARFLRLGEASGTTAYDIGGTGNAGTSTSCTLGSTALVSGDTGTSYLFNGTSSKVTIPTTGLPTGNTAMAMGVGFRISALPAANASLVSYGPAAGTAHQSIFLYITSAGKLACDVGGGVNMITGTTTITLNANHLAEVKWDGTTLTLYLDGTSQGTTTPGAQSVPASPLLLLGVNTNGSANWFAGNLQEFYFYSAADSGQSARWTAFSTGATGTQANTMSIPAAGRVAFGSPAWGAINTWQVRFRWVSGLTGFFYLHFTDASNYLGVEVLAAGQIKLLHTIAGTVNTLAQATITLTHEAWYWLQVTQFPAATGNAPYVQMTLFYDNAGAVGAQVTNGALGPVATQDAVTALSGRPQLNAVGAALALGGNFTNVHTAALFGPGGWSFAAQNGTATAPASLAWEQTAANTYPNGPVTSYGAARIDVPPAGTTDARLGTWDGTAATAAQFGIPTSQNHVLGFSVAYKTTAGLSATSMVQLLLTEYTSAGAIVGVTSTQNILNGVAQTAWTTYSTTYTILNATCAYVRVQLRVVDTTAGGSANATVWFDNAQLWDQTTTGQTTMPYCELRFPQAPAQLVVSGLLGDMAVPCMLACGTYLSNWPANSQLRLLVGRRGQSSAGAVLVGDLFDFPQANPVGVLDAASYGGWYINYTSFTNVNPQVSSNPTNTSAGIFHMITRLRSQQVAGNIPKVFASTNGYTTNGLFFLAATVALDYIQYPLQTVFTGSSTNVWTMCDHGLISVPLFARGAGIDTSQTYTSVIAAVNDQSGGSISTGQANWGALLPIDASVVSATMINPSGGGAVTSSYIWMYADGLGIALSLPTSWTFSQETKALANEAHSAGGPGTTSANTINITPLADPYATLDPNLSGNNQAGVNQLAAILTDGSASVLSFYSEIQYIPQYLYQR